MEENGSCWCCILVRDSWKFLRGQFALSALNSSSQWHVDAKIITDAESDRVDFTYNTIFNSRILDASMNLALSGNDK